MNHLGEIISLIVAVGHPYPVYASGQDRTGMRYALIMTLFGPVFGVSMTGVAFFFLL